MSLFEKQYKLTIGNPYVVPPTGLSGNIRELESFYTNAEVNGFVFTDHQIMFNINKGSTANNRKSTLSIVNLSKDKVDYLVQNRDKNVVIKLEAGYKDNLKVVFKGTVDKVENTEDTQDRITKLTLGEGSVNKKEATTLRAYPRGTDINLMVQDIITDLGIPVGNIQQILGNTIYPLKKTWHGSTSSILAQIADWYDYRFSIQNGAAYFVDDNARFIEQVALLTKDTGLIGFPKPITENASVTTNSTTSQIGFKVKCLMDGSIQPETTVYLRSGDIDDAFKVIKVDYKGNYRGNDWYCEFECKKVTGVIV